MKVIGHVSLMKSFKDLPREARKELSKVVVKSINETAKVARNLAPVDSGETRDMIHTRFANNGLEGTVEAAPQQKDLQIKVHAIEFGRTENSVSPANPYIRPASNYLKKKLQGRIKRAINLAAKRAFNG